MQKSWKLYKIIILDKNCIFTYIFFKALLKYIKLEHFKFLCNNTTVPHPIKT